MNLAQALIDWNAIRPIRYPWIGETNPYRILLSEFLLQQTRSDQALPYYKSMLQAFPTVSALATASEDDLMRQWQGLGYYSRARNLHKAAKAIVSDHGGNVPASYDLLIELPGIGPYTAAAISSFAFGEQQAVVDGNVYRVLSRYAEIDTPVNSSPARKEFTALATQLLSDSNPAAFNQAIMNLGAQVCLPKNPLCDTCPWQDPCLANTHGSQALFPVKKKKTANRHRYFHFIDITYRGRTLITKRDESDIWQGLYQFPLLERKSDRALSQATISSFLLEQFGVENHHFITRTDTHRQTLSHQYIHSRFYQIKLDNKPKTANPAYKMVFRKNLATFAFPRSVTLYLQTESK